MENKAHALAAGAFVLLVSALAVALAVWLMRDTTVRATYELSTRDTISGLQEQAAVRYRGIPVGKVTAIGFDRRVPGNVLIRIAVDTDAPLTKSTFATLSYQGVTGLAYVLLEDAGQSGERLETSDGDPTRIPLRPGLLGRLQDQGAVLVARMDETARLLNEMLAPANQKALMRSVEQAGLAAASVDRLARDMGTILDAQLGPQRVNIPLFVQEAQGTLKSLQATSAEAARTAQAATRAVDEIGATARGLNARGGVLERLGTSTDALAVTAQTIQESTVPRLNRTADDASRGVRQMGRAVNAVNDNPQSLIWGRGAVPPGPGEPGFVAPGSRP